MRTALNLALFFVLSTTATFGDDLSKDKGIDGIWVIETFTLSGKPVDKFILDRLKREPYVIRNAKYVTNSGVTISFDTAKEPGVVVGEHEALDGFHGIFKIEKGKLVICRCSRDEAIPSEFKSTAENGWQLRTYVRPGADKSETRDMARAADGNLPRYLWDVSKDRSVKAFSWFDFDPTCGVIEQEAYVEFKFDGKREFQGEVDFISFSRATKDSTELQSFKVSFPPQTGEEALATLRKLAASLRLDTKRLERDAEKILSGPDYCGIILAERKWPTIDVSVHYSFDEERPYTLWILWFWDDDPE